MDPENFPRWDQGGSSFRQGGGGGPTSFIIAKTNFLENEVDCQVSKVKFDLFQASAPKCVQEKDSIMSVRH